MQYIDAELLLYQSIVFCKTICIFDPNSTPVCLLELCHLCRRISTDMSVLLDDGECSTPKMITNKTNCLRYLNCRGK